MAAAVLYEQVCCAPMRNPGFDRLADAVRQITMFP
jgi:hypothetical protein